MTALILAIATTMAASFACALFEAVILCTSVADIEALKKRSPRRGQALEKLKADSGDTISTIHTATTLTYTFGSALVGGFALQRFGVIWLAAGAAGLTVAVLIFSDVIPRNIGAAYRKSLQAKIVGPLTWMSILLRPVTFLGNLSVRHFLHEPPVEPSSDEEIILLAERGAKAGEISAVESKMIANALTLDDVRVSQIMTPRVVVTALDRARDVADLFREYKNIPFARIPVYHDDIDHIVGLVRRRDLLKAKANDHDQELVGNLMQEVHFIPETVSAAVALQMCLKTHQQLLVVLDEFGALAGVVTMEDIMEHIIGREIFEKDDVAIDMRELARTRRPRGQMQPAPRPKGGTAA